MLVPPWARHGAAKLRTSVANDESQTQGGLIDRVDEGSRPVDNESRCSHSEGESLITEAPPEGQPHLREERNHES